VRKKPRQEAAEGEGALMSVSKLIEDRYQKLSRIRELGYDPYGQRFTGHISLQAARKLYENKSEQDKCRCRVAGRILFWRDMGKLIFARLRDSSGELQVGFSKKHLDEQWSLVKLLDLGDIIGAEGEMGVTRTGELTVWADRVWMLSKALHPPPEKWHGLTDVELRYRQRYVDLFYNRDVMDTFLLRTRLIGRIRRFLEDRGFLEVETPMMQAIAGGAAARPFVTHHNALDIDLFLRISPELYLKRLLVGGFEKIYELNRNFRNEGISTQHNPEFAMLELYQAYADYNDMMELTENLICSLVEGIDKSMKLPFGDVEIDYTPPWPRRTYADLLREHGGVSMDDIRAVRAKARELEIDESGMDDAVVINAVFEATVEHKLVNPTFVMDFPAELCPLTRPHPADPRLALRFELYVASMELANAYTELNDPEVQERNLKTQLAGQDETMAVMDEDFVNALRYGMPPAGGLGIGVDRLMMVLTNSPSIRDVILFPLQKPKE